MLRIKWVLQYLFFLNLSILLIDSIHLKGFWSTKSSKLTVISRFGFQKTDPSNLIETRGYIYGNFSQTIEKELQNDQFILTNLSENDHKGVLLLVNRTIFKQMSSIFLTRKSDLSISSPSIPDDGFCEKIFDLLSPDLDAECNQKNETDTQDFVRYVPCLNHLECRNNLLKSDPIISNHQFSYVVSSQNDPSFRYLLLLPCIKTEYGQNESLNCRWRESLIINSILSYDLWIVNGHPKIATKNLIDFNHQFSYEHENLWILLILNIGYLILLAIQALILIRRKIRKFYYILSISLFIRSLSFLLICFHAILFALNGIGISTLNSIAEIAQIISIDLLCLFLLIIAKGWCFNKPTKFSRTILPILITLHTIISILLQFWIEKTVNILEDIDQYHTIPGWISLCLRIILMFWFIYELRHTMMVEQDSDRLKFYLRFGAGILVWFVHLPLVAIVAIHVDLMWRCKIISGFTSIADFLTYSMLTRLMWKTYEKRFLLPDLDSYFNGELDYYDHSFDPTETFSFTDQSETSDKKQNTDNHLFNNNANVCEKEKIKS
ncbi:hypothetical protein SSS_10838 [Sarcoptes scabiei]|uniref:GPR180/TMEM145 transmembrane domain-containing protein n=1 Tax=Sarcoptes scabiei TaxID=52283 RepID=A0A834R1Q5_SARSC|nr:hypothetical protein SSS_10838 [Sarcoptes scabiei]